MGVVSVTEGRLCIIKIRDPLSVKQGLEQMKNTLIELTTSDRLSSGDLDTYIFLDLSPFNIINSSLIGILGSIIMDPHLRLLALCGVQPSVADILKRFGIVAETKDRSICISGKSTSNLAKVHTFSSLEEGLVCLSPG